MGIGFAIPAKICQQVLNSILKDGRVVRGWLGISLLPSKQDDILVPEQNGVVVADVLRDGPAAQAGLKRGDIIMSVNGEAISTPAQLINYVALQAPSSTVSVVVKRGDDNLTLSVVIGERKSQSNKDKQFIPLPKQ